MASCTRAAITPIAVTRSSMAELDGRAPGAPYGGTDQHDRPFPAFPLDTYDLASGEGIADPALVAVAHNTSSFFSGSTILSCGLGTQVSSDPYPAGTDASLEGYAVVQFDFSVDQPVSASIQSRLSTATRYGSGFSEARVDILLGGQFVASWVLDDGQDGQQMLWTFGVGDWSVRASSLAWLGTSMSGSDLSEYRTTNVSLTVTSVPAPASLAVLGLMVFVAGRRRECSPRGVAR
jgi:hypothetical protein